MGFNSKNKNKNEFELITVCNKLNTVVIGGANKIINQFNEKHPNSKIIIYINRRYSTGGLYEKIGFKFIKKTKPNYYYIKPGKYKRESRYKYKKSVLIKMGFESSKTEELIMKELNYYRIYDSGQLKYELN
jgi:hypothetical protein